MHVNRWYHFLILFFVGTLFYLFRAPEASEFLSVNLAVAAGAGVVYLFISMVLVGIPATVYRIKKKSWPAWISAGAAIAMAVLLYFSDKGFAQ